MQGLVQGFVPRCAGACAALCRHDSRLVPFYWAGPTSAPRRSSAVPQCLTGVCNTYECLTGVCNTSECLTGFVCLCRPLCGMLVQHACAGRRQHKARTKYVLGSSLVRHRAGTRHFRGLPCAGFVLFFFRLAFSVKYSIQICTIGHSEVPKWADRNAKMGAPVSEWMRIGTNSFQFMHFVQLRMPNYRNGHHEEPK